MPSISNILQIQDDRATELLNSLLRHVATVSVAGIGFLFSVRSAGFVTADPIWLYRLALCGFLVSVMASLYGQVAIVSSAFQEQSKLPKFLLSSKFWFILAWLGFLVGVAALFLLAL